MQTYADIIDDYDIIFVQELRDKDESAPNDLWELLPDYQFAISSRPRRFSSKEAFDSGDFSELLCSVENIKIYHRKEHK